MPDMIVASTTATQEEIDHAVSPDWRTAIPVKEPEKPATDKPAVEEEKEVPQASEEADTVTASDPEVEQDEKPKGKGGFQRKIDKLTREKSEERERADRLESELTTFREKLAAIEGRLAGKPAETKEEKPVKPGTLAAKPLES